MNGSREPLRPSQSLADLSSDGGQRHLAPHARERSGSTAAFLDLPPNAAQSAGPKRLSTPNIAHLADQISRVELAKLQRFGQGDRGDGDQAALSRHGSQASLNTSGMDSSSSPNASAHRDGASPQSNAQTPPADYAAEAPPYFGSGGMEPHRNSHSSHSSGLDINSGPAESSFPEDDRFRANSLQGDATSVSQENQNHLGEKVRRSSNHNDPRMSRPVFATPSLPELMSGKLNLRSVHPEDRKSSPSEERSPRHTQMPTSETDGAGNPGRESAFRPPPLPPPRPNRMLNKRYSVPDLLDGGDEDIKQGLAVSDLFRRRMTSADITSSLHGPQGYHDDVSNVMSAPTALHHRSTSRMESLGNLSSSSPSFPGDKSPQNKSPSLRRKALETLSLKSTQSNDSDDTTTSNASTAVTTTSNTNGYPVPAISITGHEDDVGPFSPEMDYPQNDLSPTSSHPEPPRLRPLSLQSGDSSNVYKSVSDVTSSSYNISNGSVSSTSNKGAKSMDDTRSTNTDSGVDEEERKESGSWRPYDTFQISERESDDDGAVFREILKVLRLVLYVFIMLTVLSGTIASRLSLFLLTAGIGQSGTTPGESTVMLLFCICAPIAINWLFSFAKILFSGKQWPAMSTLFCLLVVELLQTFGVCLLLFRVLPALDFFRGITVTMATFQVPALLKLFFTERKLNAGIWSFLKLLSPFLALAAQVAAIVFFLVTSFPGDAVGTTVPAIKTPRDVPHLSQLTWELPVALVLISLGWWENYISGQWSLFGNVTFTFKRGRQAVQEARDTSNFLVAPFKVGLSVALAKYLTGTTFLLPEKPADDPQDATMYHLDHYSLLYLQLGASILVTYLASLACKLHMQRTAFAFPLLLSPAASLGIVYLQCRYNFLPSHWHMGVWLCPSLSLGDLLLPLSCAGALWISYCLVVSHVWFPKNERMAKVERLFVTPHFDAIFPDFHLTSRRRQNDYELRATRLEQFTYVGEDSAYPSGSPEAPKDDAPPMVYVCATMWHETHREMTQLLKSLFRLDYLHCASKLAQDQFDIKDPDYYDLEIHVLFDDAFELDDDADRYVPNVFVRQLIECMEDAARSVLKGPIDIPPPVKSATPYGGRLVWTMPGQTKMYVHIKNKNLIRHRKRWSQCMYLYYLLGYRLLGGKDDTQSDTMSENNDSDHQNTNVRHRGDKQQKVKAKTKRRKKAAMPLRALLGHMSPEKYERTIQISENTFILTLDGDVDFKPNSVRLLLDRMKKNKKVGAVCGRIHPIGSGPMVWYQQFEYAVGHWLQKASEHVFGCVLCCPGCFSLFRGSALMDDNVVKKYTTKPTEAAHYIQFEQGEDRWLCTLLLQQGHRIDYSAGADALTFAPETFNEFFNQRRRWSPSTLANMMDLLSSWRETVRINDNISRLYILYQFMLMASSILAPSTVILMITGSYHSVLGISVWWSYLLSIAPVIFYLCVCLTQKNDVQIKIGAVLTALYTVVMMIATVGTMISIATESFNSPNVVFLTGLFVIFFVASLLHPQEFFCLVYGALYFLVVPSTFILLTVYYLCNLNNVSWGTREMPKKLTPEEEEAQKLAEEEKANKKKKNLFSFYGVVSLIHELRDAVRGLWGLREELNQKGNVLTQQQQVQQDVEKAMVSPLVIPPPQPPARLYPPGYEPNPETPYWVSLDYLGYGMVTSLGSDETEFWKFLINKYLYPLDEDKTQKAKIAEDLIIIRNNVVFIYVMMNFLWCVIALQLQAMEGNLKMFYIVEKYEPLSLVFLTIFALVLLLQFLSMLVHRWGTFLHLMASTRIDWCKKTFSEEEFARYVVNQTKMLQNLEPSPDYDEEDADSSEEDGMSMADFHPSLHDNDQKIPGRGGEHEGGGIYETLSHHHNNHHHHNPYQQFRYPQLHRNMSSSGQFPMLKTIFEQNLTNLQQRIQQRGTMSRQQGRAVARPAMQRRHWGDRYGDMRQRFVHQNFQMPHHRNTRLFRGEDGMDLV